MRASTALALLFGLLAHAAPAQNAAPVPRLAARLDVGATVFDNFLQTPAGLPESDLWAEFARCELAWRLGAERHLRLALEPEFMNYERFGGSPALKARLARTGKVHSFGLGASQAWRRPHVDLDDNVRPSDTFGLDADYSVRKGQAQLTLRGQYRADAVPEPDPDATFSAGGASLRWRPKKGKISPEMGVLVGRRDSDVVQQSYLQRDVTLKLVATPTPWAYLSFGWRKRHRDYDTHDATSRYFGRDDDRTQLSLSAHFDASERAAWNLYWSLEEAESDQPGHAYVSHVVSAWYSRKF